MIHLTIVLETRRFQTRFQLLTLEYGFVCNVYPMSCLRFNVGAQVFSSFSDRVLAHMWKKLNRHLRKVVEIPLAGIGGVRRAFMIFHHLPQLELVFEPLVTFSNILAQVFSLIELCHGRFSFVAHLPPPFLHHLCTNDSRVFDNFYFSDDEVWIFFAPKLLDFPGLAVATVSAPSGNLTSNIST